MGLRKRAFLIGVMVTFYSSFAAALGLGEIKLNSALNQPLDAEIELLHVRDLTEREIIVGLASIEDFERAGVERNYFLADLKFKLDLGAKGGPIVRVTTSETVREPYLNFIISAQWPSGKLLREYTLLIDLPIFAEAKPAAVQPARRPAQTVSSPRPSTQSSTNRPARSNSRPTAQPAPIKESFSGDNYGPVSSNDTLWNIANSVRPDKSVSVQQTMLALQRLNPDAFINNNINLLRKGQVLRVPSREEIVALSSRDAVRQVAQQNRAWSEGSSTNVSAQLEGSKTLSSTRGDSGVVEGRIKLSSVDQSEQGEGIGSGDGDGGQRAIESQLNSTQEELDAANRESADLKARIEAMEEQIQTIEKLVEVSNDEMRALELAAKQTNEEENATEAALASAGEAATEAATEESTLGETEEAGESVSGEVAANETEATTAAEAVASSSAAKVEEPKPAVKPVQSTPKTKSWLDIVQENLLYIAGGVGGLIVLLAVFLFMRKRDDGFDDDFDDELDQLRDDFEAPNGMVVEDSYEEDDSTAVQESLEDDLNHYEEDEVAAVEAETEDVVGECDIHIAYGQYDQAEDKLIRALEKDPQNIDVRLKLLEVFAAQNDVEGFDSHYAKIRAIAPSEMVDRATMLRGSLDGAGEFDESRYDTSALLAPSGEDDYAATDTEIAGVGSEDAEDTFDYANDDTLQFDFDDGQASAEVEGLADDNIDLTGEPVANEDPMNEEFAALDEELSGVDFDLPEDEISLELDDDITLDEELTGGDDLDIQLPESSYDVASTELEEPDLDFSLGEGLDSVEPDSVDALAEDDFASEFETADTSDLSIGDDLAIDDDTEFAPAAEPTTDQVALEFDLDKDLEDAIATEGDLALSSGDDLSNLDFEDLGDIDLDESLSGIDETLDEGLLAGDEGPSESIESDEDTTFVAEFAETSDSSDEQDFDVDFDLDGGDIDIDGLDKELGELDLDMDDEEDTESFTGGMDEPMTDFAETSGVLKENDGLDLEEQPTAAEAAASAPAKEDLDFQIPDFDPENDDDSNLDFLSDNDETATKLDLARAYIDMGDSDGAKDILDEIVEEGNDTQRKEAETLLSKLAS